MASIIGQENDTSETNDLNDLDFDNLLLNSSSDNVELVDYDKEFDATDTGDSTPNLVEQFEIEYKNYQAKFGRTFDPYLVKRNPDNEIEQAIEKMKAAIDSGKPLDRAI